MSFKQLKKAELLAAADHFGVEVDAEHDTNPQLVEKLVNDGISFAMYQEAFPEDEPEEDEAKAEASVEEEPENVEDEVAEVEEQPRTVVGKNVTLIKMIRNNPVYEVRGYRFERDKRPFVLVDNADVDFLIEVEGGFTVAKPSEVEAFYR